MVTLAAYNYTYEGLTSTPIVTRLTSKNLSGPHSLDVLYPILLLPDKISLVDVLVISFYFEALLK